MMTDNSSEKNELSELIHLIHTLTGINLTEQKKTMIIRRITPSMRTLGVTSILEYCQEVQKSPELKQELINVITTNETQFFRTKRIWEYFSNDYLKNWFEKNRGMELKIWSCASSSGEEPYSIAILCEEFKKHNKDFKYSILATDIATDELAKAEKGLFGEKQVLSILAKFPLNLEEYFLKKGNGENEIKPHLKQHIVFKQHNLFGTLAQKTMYDLVFLRNVLIYFEKHDQTKVITNIQENLKNSAILILGESESLNNQLPTLQYMAPLIYKKVG